MTRRRECALNYMYVSVCALSRVGTRRAAGAGSRWTSALAEKVAPVARPFRWRVAASRCCPAWRFRSARRPVPQDRHAVADDGAPSHQRLLSMAGEAGDGSVHVVAVASRAEEPSGALARTRRGEIAEAVWWARRRCHCRRAGSMQPTSPAIGVTTRRSSALFVRGVSIGVGIARALLPLRVRGSHPCR
jgi:hypothetical protein